MNLVERIIAYENGDLSEQDTILLFQDLVNNGMAWRLQGHYGRMALNLIEAGLVTLVTTKDADGSIRQNGRVVTA